MKKNLLLCLALMVSGCSTSYLIKPTAQDVTWKNGKAFVQPVQDSEIQLKAAIDNHSSDSVILLVELSNVSKRKIVVTPQEFSLSHSSSHFYLNNPEEMIAFDKIRSK